MSHEKFIDPNAQPDLPGFDFNKGNSHLLTKEKKEEIPERPFSGADHIITKDTPQVKPASNEVPWHLRPENLAQADEDRAEDREEIKHTYGR